MLLLIIFGQVVVPFGFLFHFIFYKMTSNARITRQEYLDNLTIVKNGLNELEKKLEESPSYAGIMELKNQHTTDLRNTSDKRAYSMLIWSAGIALSGVIIFQISSIASNNPF